jgi:hypothetical protein
MSLEATGAEVTRAEVLRFGEDDRGYGWVIFAGTMLVVLGCTNFIEGIAAISNSDFFVTRAHYVFGDLDSYGWVLLVNGFVQAAAGLGVFLKDPTARWLGVLLAGFNALVQLLFIPAYSYWSLALFAVDVLVIYGLVVHGGRAFRPV